MGRKDVCSSGRPLGIPKRDATAPHGRQPPPHDPWVCLGPCEREWGPIHRPWRRRSMPREHGSAGCGSTTYRSVAKLTLCKVDAQNRQHRAQKGAHRAQLVLPFHLVQGRASNSKNLALGEDLSDFGSCQLEGSPDPILRQG